jgi:hypothetical protein
MSETRIRIRLLWMYFPRNWEFGSALSKLQNFGGGFEPPPPSRYATGRLGGPLGRSGQMWKIRSPDSPARSESLYRLSYPGPQSLYRLSYPGPQLLYRLSYPGPQSLYRLSYPDSRRVCYRDGKSVTTFSICT